MPYVEVLSSVDAPPEARQAFVATITEAITADFNVSPSAVTVFFLPVAPLYYGYRGELGHQAGPPRVFIKLHAYRRTAQPRRAVAMPISEAAARCFGTTLAEVSIYFLEREFDEVTHDGVLVSDDKQPVL
jgi:phenylpyruvate tautomerase PptA (4-oxalocrotonate tautomerase family)